MSDSSDLLSALNEQCTVTYNRARDHLISTIDPFIICNGDNVIIRHRGERFEEQVIPKLYHDLKSISHIPFKIYLTLIFSPTNLSQNDYDELEQYLHDIRSLRDSIEFPSAIQPNQYDIIDLSVEYLREILKTKNVDSVQLQKFCRQARSLFAVNIELAARIHLDLLHAKIKPWYEDRFNDAERNSVKIIITGPKTARYGYLEKAYFYSLLGEHHEGKHIIYAESITDEQKALELLGVWLLDAKASKIFFDSDSERLHRDLLADAANTHIKKLVFKSQNE